MEMKRLGTQQKKKSTATVLVNDTFGTSGQQHPGINNGSL